MCWKAFRTSPESLAALGAEGGVGGGVEQDCRAKSNETLGLGENPGPEAPSWSSFPKEGNKDQSPSPGKQASLAPIRPTKGVAPSLSLCQGASVLAFATTVDAVPRMPSLCREAALFVQSYPAPQEALCGEPQQKADRQKTQLEISGM